MMWASLMMGASAAPALATRTYLGEAHNGSALTTYTFSSVGLGTAAADRKIVVGVTGIGQNNNFYVTSVTVGGVGATLVKATMNADRPAELWIAPVPGGTSGDIVVTFTGGQSACGIGMWALYGAGGIHATAGSTADPMSAGIDCPANGVVIGIGTDMNEYTFTWTGPTEDFEDHVRGSGYNGTFTGASAQYATTQTGLTVTCDPSGTAYHPAMAAASWGPA